MLLFPVFNYFSFVYNLDNKSLYLNYWKPKEKFYFFYVFVFTIIDALSLKLSNVFFWIIENELSYKQFCLCWRRWKTFKESLPLE